MEKKRNEKGQVKKQKERWKVGGGVYLKKGKNSEENKIKMKVRRRNDEKTGKEDHISKKSELQMRNIRGLEERKNESKKGVGEVGCWRLK